MNRKQTFFLAMSPCGSQRLSARIAKSMPGLKRDEIALALTIELPDALFKKPQLTASVVVPESSVKGPVLDANVVDNIQSVISRQLGVDLKISLVNVDASTDAKACEQGK
jgi:hypothetical protein